MKMYFVFPIAKHQVTTLVSLVTPREWIMLLWCVSGTFPAFRWLSPVAITHKLKNRDWLWFKFLRDADASVKGELTGLFVLCNRSSGNVKTFCSVGKNRRASVAAWVRWRKPSRRLEPGKWREIAINSATRVDGTDAAVWAGFQK